MKRIVISGDVIASTSLSDAGRKLIEDSLKELNKELHNTFNTYARILRGDYIECVVPIPQDALQVALAIKSFVKTIPLKNPSLYKTTNSRVKKFTTYGIRLALGYGELSRFDPEEGVIDGEAIYLSGRTINEFSTYNKKRIVIKNTLFFISQDGILEKHLVPIFSLLDLLLNKATPKQCQVLFLKLMKNNEEEIKKILKIDQSLINRRSTTIGWNAIEKSIIYFREII